MLIVVLSRNPNHTPQTTQNPDVSVDTKTFSKIHNYFLCLISFVMFAGAFFHFFVAKTAPPSFQDAFCNLEGVPLAPEFSFWIYMYYLRSVVLVFS